LRLYGQEILEINDMPAWYSSKESILASEYYGRLEMIVLATEYCILATEYVMKGYF
jgi:hypothetical protein